MPRFEPASFSDFQHVSAKDWENAKQSFQSSCALPGFRQSSLWGRSCASLENQSSARNFFSNGFTVWKILDEKLTDGASSFSATGLLTGYYEPVLKASLKRTAQYSWPVLSTPPDLIDVDLVTLYPELKGKRVRGKLSGRRLIPYDDRHSIDERRDLYPYAIAWLSDPIDQLFLQIQGSGQLQIPGRGVIRVTYANQNGHPYKAVAQWLIRKGYITPKEASMQAIRAWAKDNPGEIRSLLDYNPSYVFFRQDLTARPGQGPRGAQGVPLTPLASVAVDRSIWKFGSPFILQVRQSSPDIHFVRPVIAQDTGGAIRGILRFDYFWGSGDEAGDMAGRQKSQVSAWILVPRGHRPEELLRP
ncbi:MltA domain-containing protein [Mesosutterella sp. OilRF-GAM-744-9]|uniref:peptidoglycan lytic exotransglycosylase n=1 Tax=Mesosutterella porci TaxID=2915351 RepID=A0ABS9MR04_9BURK|nr:MltA domain-containing protein [Mesosutterella sp. oilRF-744-WT-GAM-9]MCG5031063.1 MltA domain-containing protein [Mesosutterella sp. oilRF-744-WT-GAM-9]